MPTYEYVCKACDHEFEREQRISDDPIKTCPSCKAKQVKRLISRTSFHLKGGGWYSDLYSSPGKKGAKKDGDSKSSSSESSAKSDSGGSGTGSAGSGSGSSKDGGSGSKAAA